VVTLGHPGLTYIVIFGIRAICHSALSSRDGIEHFEMQPSEWYLTPLRLKG